VNGVKIGLPCKGSQRSGGSLPLRRGVWCRREKTTPDEFTQGGGKTTQKVRLIENNLGESLEGGKAENWNGKDNVSRWWGGGEVPRDEGSKSLNQEGKKLKVCHTRGGMDKEQRGGGENKENFGINTQTLHPPQSQARSLTTWLTQTRD